MYAKALLIAGCLTAALASAPAPVITDNRDGEWYIADLKSGPGGLTGSIGIMGDIEGRGVRVSYSFAGFNLTDSTEYSYHIHEHPVPSDGNCNSTGQHFDKYGVGDDYTCDKSQPDLCQLGDLSGKHGIIQFNTSAANLSDYAYHDEFLSTTAGNTAFFGNLSIVVHRKRDKFRLACGNFYLFWSPANMASYGPLPEQTAILANTTTSSDAPFPNATSTQVISSTVTEGNTAQPRSTITQAVTEGQTSAAQASSSPGSTSSSVSIQSGDAISRKRMRFVVLALQMIAIGTFVWY